MMSWIYLYYVMSFIF